MVEVCRQLGVSVATFYHWQRTFGTMGISELNELRVLRDENQRLKRLVADLTLDKHILQEVTITIFVRTASHAATKNRPLSRPKSHTGGA